MSPLETVVSEFTARMQADAGSPDPALWSSSNILLGKKHLYSNKASPRIVIVPEGGKLSAELVRPGGNPRSLLVRTVTLRFFCFATTYEGVEALLHNAIRAIRNTVHAAFEPGDEFWLSEDLGQRDIDSPCVGFSVIVQIPVYDLLVETVEPPLTHAIGEEGTEPFEQGVIFQDGQSEELVPIVDT